jgi:tetratricopeptide (TPR) repeat protein
MNIDAACFEKFAMILVGTSVAGAGVAGVALPNGVIESLVGGFGLWAKAKQDANVTATQVVRRMTTELQREWQTWGALSSHANEGIRANALASFQEVVPLCALLPQDVVGQRLSPEGVAALFLAKAAQVLPSVYANPDPRNPETHLARQFLLRITTRAYAHLVAEPGYIAQIAPALWQATLEVQARIEAKVDLLVEQLPDTIRQLGLAMGTVIGIAKVFAADVEDFETALRELTRAVGIAARFERQGSLPAQTGDQITAVMAEVARLNRSQNFAEAATVIADSYERIEAERARLIEVGLEQAVLSRNAPDAAKWALYKVKLTAQVPDLFDALRDEQDRWYVTGRDKGLAFDLQVAIAIAQASCNMATSPDQRGMALNNLGNTRCILGERETGTARLMEAVAAYHAALQECTRDRAPLDWAMIQNNLGNALCIIGKRETGTARLMEAVAAYHAALQECTRDLVPLDWAATQNNLGTALQTLGERETGTTRLMEAVAAYHAALQERTRDRVPLDWAMTQNNLGNTLCTFGERETGTARLMEAVAAYHAALQGRTRDRVPLDWAATQNNLGTSLQTLGERETGTKRLLESVAAYHAALQVFTRDRVPLDWAATQNNLGTSLQTLGARETGTARLLESVAAYHAALQERTRDRVPLDWAMTQMNLGTALRILGERETGTIPLLESVAAYHAALQEYTRDRVPLNWAGSRGNLGWAMVTLAHRTNDLTMARQALAQLVEAETLLREGGHLQGAESFALRIPGAQAVIDRLSSPGKPA